MYTVFKFCGPCESGRAHSQSRWPSDRIWTARACKGRAETETAQVAPRRSGSCRVVVPKPDEVVHEASGSVVDREPVDLAGDGFGQQGKGFLRFSYANSIENIGEALKRLEAFVRQL